jgi:hypothetical protein
MIRQREGFAEHFRLLDPAGMWWLNHRREGSARAACCQVLLQQLRCVAARAVAYENSNQKTGRSLVTGVNRPFAKLVMASHQQRLPRHRRE